MHHATATKDHAVHTQGDIVRLDDNSRISLVEYGGIDRTYVVAVDTHKKSYPGAINLQNAALELAKAGQIDWIAAVTSDGKFFEISRSDFLDIFKANGQVCLTDMKEV